MQEPLWIVIILIVAVLVATAAGLLTRRELELGTCARACRMLRPDPAQARRLAEIIANLHDRIREAPNEGGSARSKDSG